MSLMRSLSGCGTRSMSLKSLARCGTRNKTVKRLQVQRKSQLAPKQK
jgi:hypothetical protein